MSRPRGCAHRVPNWDSLGNDVRADIVRTVGEKQARSGVTAQIKALNCEAKRELDLVALTVLEEGGYTDMAQDTATPLLGEEHAGVHKVAASLPKAPWSQDQALPSSLALPALPWVEGLWGWAAEKAAQWQCGDGGEECEPLALEAKFKGVPKKLRNHDKIISKGSI